MGIPPQVYKDYVCKQCGRIMRAGEFLEEHEAERHGLCPCCFFEFRTKVKCGSCGLTGCTVQENGGWYHHKCWYEGDIYFNRMADYAVKQAKELFANGGFVAGKIISWGVVFAMDFDTPELRKRFYASPQFSECMEIFVETVRKSYGERQVRKAHQYGSK